ncbi:plasma membrane Ca2+ ATPase [Plasmodium ovale wallikeri]|uniref:Plasma membrane Ca2+ ATPase n=1 Tax=Plasmodium ovale wallikeri TaxID=864142 RepID=A0A1A8Z7W4_PLAOA|nr:plasma membrane Ca2+ ATPase [Plasmodium ovale wallikeri]
MNNEIAKSLFPYDAKFFKGIFDKYLKDEDYSKDLKIIQSSRNLMEEVISKENGLNFYLDENNDDKFLKECKLPFFKKLLKYVHERGDKGGVEDSVEKSAENIYGVSSNLEVIKDEQKGNDKNEKRENGSGRCEKGKSSQECFVFNKKINVINSYRIYCYCSNIIQSLPSLTYLSVVKIYLSNYPLKIFLSCVYFYTFVTYVCDRDNVIEFLESLFFSLLVTIGCIALAAVHYIKENRISIITSRLNNFKECYTCRNFIKNQKKNDKKFTNFESKKTLEIKKYSKYFFLKSFLNRINVELFDYEVFKNGRSLSYVQDLCGENYPLENSPVTFSGGECQRSISPQVGEAGKVAEMGETGKAAEMGEAGKAGQTDEIGAEMGKAGKAGQTDEIGAEMEKGKNVGENFSEEGRQDSDGKEAVTICERERGGSVYRKSNIIVPAKEAGEERKRRMMEYILYENNIYLINGKNLLVGDIIYLFKGDVIPADGILIKSKNLIVDESSILKYSKKGQKKISLDEYIYEREKSKKRKISVNEFKKRKLTYFEALNLRFKTQLKRYSGRGDLKKDDTDQAGKEVVDVVDQTIAVDTADQTNVIDAIDATALEGSRERVSINCGYSVDQMPLLLQNCIAINSKRLMNENFLVKSKNTFEKIILTNCIFIDIERYVKCKCSYFFYNGDFSLRFDDDNNEVNPSHTDVDENIKIIDLTKEDSYNITDRLFFVLLIQCMLTTSNMYQYNEHYMNIDMSLLKFFNRFKVHMEDYFVKRKNIFLIISTPENCILSFVLSSSLFLTGDKPLKDIKEDIHQEGGKKPTVLRIFLRGRASAILPRCSHYTDGDSLRRDVEKLRKKTERVSQRGHEEVLCFAYKEVVLEEKERESFFFYEEDNNDYTFDRKEEQRNVNEACLKYADGNDFTCVCILVFEKTLSKHFHFDYKLLEANGISVKLFTQESFNKTKKLLCNIPNFFANLKMYDAKKLHEIYMRNNFHCDVLDSEREEKKKKKNLEDVYVEKIGKKYSNKKVMHTECDNFNNYKLEGKWKGVTRSNKCMSETLNLQLCNESNLMNTLQQNEHNKIHENIFSQDIFYNCSKKEISLLLHTSKRYGKNGIVTNQSDLGVEEDICTLRICDNRYRKNSNYFFTIRSNIRFKKNLENINILNNIDVKNDYRTLDEWDYHISPSRHGTILFNVFFLLFFFSYLQIYVKTFLREMKEYCHTVGRSNNPSYLYPVNDTNESICENVKIFIRELGEGKVTLLEQQLNESDDMKKKKKKKNEDVIGNCDNSTRDEHVSRLSVTNVVSQIKEKISLSRVFPPLGTSPLPRCEMNSMIVKCLYENYKTVLLFLLLLLLHIGLIQYGSFFFNFHVEGLTLIQWVLCFSFCLLDMLLYLIISKLGIFKLSINSFKTFQHSHEPWERSVFDTMNDYKRSYMSQRYKYDLKVTRKSWV